MAFEVITRYLHCTQKQWSIIKLYGSSEVRYLHNIEVTKFSVPIVPAVGVGTCIFCCLAIWLEEDLWPDRCNDREYVPCETHIGLLLGKIQEGHSKFEVNWTWLCDDSFGKSCSIYCRIRRAHRKSEVKLCRVEYIKLKLFILYMRFMYPNKWLSLWLYYEDYALCDIYISKELISSMDLLSIYFLI